MSVLRRSLATVLVQFPLFMALVGADDRSAAADDPPTVRSQAVVNLTFDEAAGAGLDSAQVGAANDSALLQNGAVRIRSPFPGQSGKQAVVLDAAARQFIQIADSPDVDRPEAVSFSLFFADLHPAGDAAFHGVVAKRDDAKQITNYGINYANNTDAFQVYVNDGTGFKAAVYSVNAAVGHRHPVFLTVVFQVGDAPAPDADEDKDDLLIRLYANGQPVKPKVVNGGQANENDSWLTDVKVGNLLNDVPLTLGSSSTAIEFTTCLVDEFSLFARALTPEEAARLFVEVAGPNVPAQVAEDAKPLAAGPEISSLSLNGLTRGHATVIAVTGANLLPDPILVSPAPMEKQVLRPGATAERAEFEVTVPATAAAGHFPIRVQNARGISGALTIAVDSLPQIPLADSSPDRPVTLPAAISGTLSGQQQVRVFFHGKAGQHVIVDLECRRLGAAMDPVLELRNPRGAPLNIAWGRPQYRGDTRIEANLFADGVYSVELHDLAYKAPGQSIFRLKIGDLKIIDTTFPPAVSAGSQRAVAAIGPGMDSAAMLAVDMSNQLPGLVRSLGLPPETGTVGPAPTIVSSGAIEVVEEPHVDGKLQTVDVQFAEKEHVPVVINGRIARHGETDRYVLQVKPGATLRLSSESHNLHSPLDAEIIVSSHPEGSRLAMSEERPVLDFGVPAGVSVIQVAIRDINHRGGPDYVYRLQVARAGHADFTLAVGSERTLLARDGTAVLRLDVNRSGYDGPITLSLQGASEISLAPTEIPAGASKALLVLSAHSAETSPAALIKHLRLVGTSVGLDPPIVRGALVPGDSRLALVPATRSELTCTLTGSSAAVLEAGSLPPAWFRGTAPEIPLLLKEHNPDLARHALRLTLLTTEVGRTQIDPTDPTQQRRLPIPMLHSLPEQTLAPGEATGILRVAIPLEIVEGQIDCVIRGDFVAHAFSDRILATVYSPAFRLPVQNAVSVQPAANNLSLSGGTQTKFAGTVKRTVRFADAIEVALVNLPAGYSAPKVTVPADQEQFEIIVAAPAVAAAADLPNVQFRVTAISGGLLQKDTPIATKAVPGQ